jgi:hypothetical protein
MTSYVHVERTVNCPFSVAAEYAAKHLRGFEEPTAEPIRVPLVALGLPLPGALRRRVRFSFKVQYDAIGTLRRQSDEILFRWRAGSFWLPDFGGTLRFRIASYRETLLVLEGTYVPPFGIAGRAFDELFGREIAATTAEDLLARVGAGLEADERAFRAAHQPAS